MTSVAEPGGEAGNDTAAGVSGLSAAALASWGMRMSSGTRTGDLLGAIQGAQRLNVAILQGDSGDKRQRDVSEIVRNLRDFPRVLARGGVHVAKPLTAIQAGSPGAARSLARFLASDNGDQVFPLPAECSGPGRRKRGYRNSSRALACTAPAGAVAFVPARGGRAGARAAPGPAGMRAAGPVNRSLA
jgi:hypothetical protein